MFLLKHLELHPRQFSLREAFLWTLVVAATMTVGILCRDSRTFRGLYSVWTLASLLIIAAVCFVHRFQVVRPITLARGSVGLYILSLCLPAIFVPYFNRNEMTFGWALAWSSTIDLRESLYDLFTNDSPSRWMSAAWFFGGTANVLFIVGYVAVLSNLKWAQAVTVARWSGIAGFVAAIASRLLAEYELGNRFGGSHVFYAGFGVWAASLLALALASSSNTAPNVNTNRS